MTPKGKTMQAVRRSARYLRLRTWWRGLHLDDQADALLAGVVFVVYVGAAIFVPELFR